MCPFFWVWPQTCHLSLNNSKMLVNFIAAVYPGLSMWKLKSLTINRLPGAMVSCSTRVENSSKNKVLLSRFALEGGGRQIVTILIPEHLEISMSSNNSNLNWDCFLTWKCFFIRRPTPPAHEPFLQAISQSLQVYQDHYWQHSP